VSFTKGCYLGQEVVERVSARGKVNKKLTGLRLEGDVVPAAQTPLRADGREIGRITSAVHSPALDQVIALAYVHRDFLEPGTTVAVTLPSSEVNAVVTHLPFEIARTFEPSIP
jgi:aminomethyltransferase